MQEISTAPPGGYTLGDCYTDASGCGTVFKLSNRGSGWILSTIYQFQGRSDGAWPYANMIFGPDGALYGTTAGLYDGECPPHCGTVFKMQPSPTFCPSVQCFWRQTVLYEFDGQVGAKPRSPVTFDPDGNIYGTTSEGGSDNCGIVYQLAAAQGG